MSPDAALLDTGAVGDGVPAAGAGGGVGAATGAAARAAAGVVQDRSWRWCFS